jgi:hypothetical protein
LTYGTCYPLSLYGKCTGEVVAGNDGGTFITAAPTDCASTDASLNIKDPSIYINDENVKEVLSAINSGTLTEGTLQVVLSELEISGVTIKRILSAAIAAGDSGTISTLIEISVTIDLTTLCQRINECYKRASGREVSFDNCRIEQSQSTTKRATSNEYVHTSNVHAITSTPGVPNLPPPGTPGSSPPPSNPPPNNLGGNSSSHLAPTLFLSLVIFFLFRFM